MRILPDPYSDVEKLIKSTIVKLSSDEREEWLKGLIDIVKTISQECVIENSQHWMQRIHQFYPNLIQLDIHFDHVPEMGIEELWGITIVGTRGIYEWSSHWFDKDFVESCEGMWSEEIVRCLEKNPHLSGCESQFWGLMQELFEWLTENMSALNRYSSWTL